MIIFTNKPKSSSIYYWK